MDQKLFESGDRGCNESNIGKGHTSLNNSIFGWVSDKDSGNFDRMPQKMGIKPHCEKYRVRFSKKIFGNVQF